MLGGDQRTHWDPIGLISRDELLDEGLSNKLKLD